LTKPSIELARHGRSSFPPLTVALHNRLDFQVRHEEQVDEIDGVVRLADKQDTPAWNRHNKLAVMHGNLASVGKVNYERLEGLGCIETTDLRERHTVLQSEGGTLDFTTARAIGLSRRHCGTIRIDGTDGTKVRWV
jgi:hypothetical protein